MRLEPQVRGGGIKIRMSLEILYFPVANLIPYARNARTHSDAQVAQVAASIREFGWTNPVLIDPEGGIIAGHGRVLAARKLGMADVPCITLGHLTETQRRAYVITDNKLALNSGWDEEMLRLELTDLQAMGADLGLIGFRDDELDKLFADEAAGLTDPDEVPEAPVDPISRPGDIWICGEHRVLCGDATVLGDVETLLNGELADMTFCDPPTTSTTPTRQRTKCAARTARSSTMRWARALAHSSTTRR